MVRLHRLSAYIGLVLTGAVVLAPAALCATQDSRIGVTSAVLPQAQGEAPDGTTKVLRIGVDVVADQRVTTNSGGKVQLVFVDGSALTIGPNSDVVLDEFVYDPQTKEGNLSFAATKGVFRLVGGSLSKKNPVKIKFPTATMGIRGGIAMVQAGSSVTGIFIYGEEMTMTSGGQTQTVGRPGFQINVPASGGPPSDPVPATTDQLGNTLEQLEANPQAQQQETGGGQQAGGPAPEGSEGGGNPNVNDEDVAETQLSELSSGTEPAPTGPAAPPATRQTPQELTVTPSQQAPLELMTATPESTETPVQAGGTSSAQGCTGLCLDGFVGRSKRGTSTATGTNDATAGDNLALSEITIGDGKFKTTATTGNYELFFPVTSGTFSVGGTNGPANSTYGSITSGTVRLTSDREFVVYELEGASRILAFAGVPTSTFPTSGISAFDFGRDFPRASDIPFMDNIATSDHGDGFIYWGQSSTSVLPAFGGGTILVKGMGSSQTSLWSTIYGRVRPDGSGRHIQATLRSQGLYAAASPARLFFGGLASSDVSGGTDFFGGTSPDYFVLESATVNDADVIQSRGISKMTQTATSTIHGNGAAFVSSNSLTSATRTAGQHTTSGFASGVVLRFDSDSVNASAVLRNRNNIPTDVRITTDADQSVVSANFRLDDIANGDDYNLLFGEATQGGRSAFINDRVFFAGESASSSTITGRVLASAAKLGLTTSAVLQHDGFLPTGVSFCSCQHLNWGIFGANFDLVGGSSEQIHLATWVQGDLTNIASFPSSGTAQYKGHVIASIVNQGNQYLAAGGISLDVAFSSGSYQLTGVQMNNLDGTNFTSTVGAAGNFTLNRYNSTTAGLTIQGNKTGTGTVTALVAGAFFGSGTGAPPETGGTVTLSGTNYKGGGTYAAAKQ